MRYRAVRSLATPAVRRDSVQVGSRLSLGFGTVGADHSKQSVSLARTDVPSTAASEWGTTLDQEG